MSNVTPLPGNIAVNLDEAEVETSPPFVVLVGGREISFSDPEDADWQDLAAVESPYDFLRLCLTPEDRAYLLEQNLSGKKFTKLMKAFQVHFGVDEKMHQARREAQRLGR